MKMGERFVSLLDELIQMVIVVRCERALRNAHGRNQSAAFEVRR
jgi:hypothetical protein